LLRKELYPPKDPAENLRWRRAVTEMAAEDADFRIDLWLNCRDDAVFFVDGFCWTYDPRKLEDPVLPFITYPYQEATLQAFESALQNRTDIGGVKSRDMGFTWTGMAFLLQRWNFFHDQSFLLVSRKEDLVDGSRDSLFAHIDFMLERLPPWMLPPDWKDHRTKLRLYHSQNHSVLEGESSNDNLGRAGRRTGLWWDEAGSFKGGGHNVNTATADVTNTRFVISTPAGTDCAYYEILTESGCPVIRAHWSQHPEKARGLYKPLPGGKVQLLDRDYDYTGYEFVLEIPRGEEKVRSPWYDKECRRRASNPQLVAQELDCDHAGAVQTLIDAAWGETYIRTVCSKPRHTGDIALVMADDELYSAQWSGDEGHGFTFTPTRTGAPGALSVWCQLDQDWRPPLDRKYAFGIDIAIGSGNSNSVVSVGDQFTSEKVAEFASNRLDIEVFCRCVVAMARMFADEDGTLPLINFEAAGPGLTFKQFLVNRWRYPSVYRRRNEKTRTNETTDTPGFYAQGDVREALLVEYREALCAGGSGAGRPFVNPSEAAIRELMRYRKEGDKFVHPLSRQRDKATGDYGRFHGDRVIADALLVKALGPISRPRIRPEAPRLERDSMRERMLQRRKEEAERDE
jgi:hypothetical protein